MEEINKTKENAFNDKKILYSKAIKAGKRIYYLDVKQNRKNDLFLAITESKKVVFGEGENTKVSFEKHKIFLYKEDFEKFSNGLEDALNFIKENQVIPQSDETPDSFEGKEKDSSDSLVDEELNDGAIKIDIDF